MEMASIREKHRSESWTRLPLRDKKNTPKVIKRKRAQGGFKTKGEGKRVLPSGPSERENDLSRGTERKAVCRLPDSTRGRVNRERRYGAERRKE